jgi:hypothetical protein
MRSVMTTAVLLVSVFFAGCASYDEFSDDTPRKNCAADASKKSEICDLRLRLYSDDKWAAHSFVVIEKYSRHDLNRTNYQLILRLALNDDANFTAAVFSVDGKEYTLKARKVLHDDTYGFREVVYFDIGIDFIKMLATGKNVSLVMIGKKDREYRIEEEDIPSIAEFYRGL